jgi:uncharacterized protein (DUF169 family)
MSDRDAPDVQKLLGLEKPPIAIGLLAAPPEGMAAANGGEVPAGCAFWSRAWSGAAFYTVPEQHFNCAVGSYTHRIELPAERAKELEATVTFMVESRYLDMSEVPGIPRVASAPAAIAYAPVGRATFAPDVILVAAKPAQAMLLYEAALKAGAGNALMNTLGRPGCAVLPLAAGTESASLSFGCKGNRTFTGLSDSELYLAVPAGRWEAVAGKLAETLEANRAMGARYEAQKSRFPIL